MRGARLILSIRQIGVSPTGIFVRGAIGAFGGVFSRLPQPSGGSSSSGPCLMTALQGIRPEDLGLPALRSFRDALQTSPAGRALVDLYWSSTPEMRRLLARHPALAARTVLDLADLSRRIEAGRPISPRRRRRYEARLRDVASFGSPALRERVERVLVPELWPVLDDAAGRAVQLRAAGRRFDPSWTS